MLRGIAVEDIAAALGFFDYLGKPATIQGMIKYLSRRFDVSEDYAEAKINEMVILKNDLIIRDGVIDLFDYEKYDDGKKDALLKKPTLTLSKDYSEGYREGKELLKYLSNLGLKVVEK